MSLPVNCLPRNSEVESIGPGTSALWRPGPQLFPAAAGTVLCLYRPLLCKHRARTQEALRERTQDVFQYMVVVHSREVAGHSARQSPADFCQIGTGRTWLTPFREATTRQPGRPERRRTGPAFASRPIAIAFCPCRRLPVHSSRDRSGGLWRNRKRKQKQAVVAVRRPTCHDVSKDSTGNS